MIGVMLLLWYRSDQYRWFEDKMDNENDSLCTYTHDLKGRKIIIAKEHITRCRGSKMFDTGTYANYKNNKTGAEVHIHPKRVDFFIFFISCIHKKIKPNIYIVFVYVQSDTLTWGYRISYYSGYANKMKKNVISFYADCVINTILHTYI